MKTLFTLAYPKKGNELPNPALAKAAKQALILIAENLPTVFVTASTDMMASKNIYDRNTALKLLSLIIKKVFFFFFFPTF